jgi:hypothetical protein
MELKPGTRLRSVVCTTEVIVVRASDDALEIRCGGYPLVPTDEWQASEFEIKPGYDEGTMLGKRYTDERKSLEVLCMKAGDGSLSLGDTPLQLSGAKPLPASD